VAANTFRTSHSKASTYRRCHHAYYKRYVLKLRRKLKGRPLQFGAIMHELIEAVANNENPLGHLKQIEKEQGKLFASQREELGDILEDAEDLIKEYEEYWSANSLEYTEYNGKSAEFKFDVEISPGIFAIGKIDGLGIYKRHQALIEHKTARVIPNEDHRWRNLQGAIYVRIAELLKLPEIDGILWDYIRSKSPARPQVLKSGKMSQRGLDTLPSRIRRTLRQHGLSEKAFSLMIKQAERNRSSYFQRIFSPVKPKVVNTLFKDFVDVSKEMAERHGEVKDRNIDRHCEWCEFEPLCRAELQGSDVNFLIKKDYTQNEKHEEDEPDFEA
jgi:hypothetical protein